MEIPMGLADPMESCVPLECSRYLFSFTAREAESQILN